MNRWPTVVILLAAVACATPASAQPTRPLRLQVPPVDLRTPPDNDPGLGAGPDYYGRTHCRPAWPCRLQLFGVIERNGGVGVKGTALTW